MNNKFENYTGNLISVLEEILSTSFKYSSIKSSFIPQVFGKIRQFSDSNFDVDERYEFVGYCSALIHDVELRLLDLEIHDLEERKDILSQIKLSMKNIFSDIEIKDDNPLTLNEKIILLEYFKVFDFLINQGLNHKKMALLFSLLLERHPDNVQKGIRNVNGKAMLQTSIKNPTALKKVKEVSDKLKFDPLTEKINNDYKPAK
jgi:hypothetical protein